jgi:hypothetical protein
MPHYILSLQFNIESMNIHKKKSFITRFFNNIPSQLLLALTVIVGNIDPAKGADFNFTYAPGTSINQMLGYEMAGRYWSNYLADDVTINIFIEQTNRLPKNVIGGALPGVTSVNFAQHNKSLGDDITSLNDYIAYENYDKAKEFRAIANKKEVKNGITEIKGIKEVNLTRANAKALGIIDGQDKGLDAYILVSDLSQVNRDLSWHYYSPNDTVKSGTLDFFSVALHEIGHTLGFISGVDSPNWISYLTDEKKLEGKKMTYSYALDMFRLSQNSSEFKGASDMSVGGKPIFSIDGGFTTLAEFSSGTRQDLGGDGNQSSHWKSKDGTLGIMDPLLGAGKRRQITNLDMTALDVIGWDLQNKSSSMETIYRDSKAALAQKIGVSVDWLDANSNQATSLLAPNWLDTDNDRLDDRGELLNSMIVNSGTTYEWGWSGYWWGWSGYWWGWSGYWQSNADFNKDGFWQHVSWQTIDEEGLAETSGTDSPQSVPEPSSLIGLLGLGWLITQRHKNKKVVVG